MWAAVTAIVLAIIGMARERLSTLPRLNALEEHVRECDAAMKLPLPDDLCHRIEAVKASGIEEPTVGDAVRVIRHGRPAMGGDI